MYTYSPVIHIRVSDRLLEKIDQAARRSWQTRSEFIRECVTLRLNKQNIVEQPDPEDELKKTLKAFEMLPDE